MCVRRGPSERPPAAPPSEGTHRWRRTLRSGQPVDTRCWEPNGTPPFSRATGSKGSYINTTCLTPPLDLWSFQFLSCTLAAETRAAAACVTFVQRRWTETKTQSASLRVCETRGRLAPADPFFDAPGRGGCVSALLQGNGWVAYLPWPVVSPETVLSA